MFQVAAFHFVIMCLSFWKKIKIGRDNLIYYVYNFENGFVPFLSLIKCTPKIEGE